MNANSIFHNKTTINITLFYMKKYFSRLRWPNEKKKKKNHVIQTATQHHSNWFTLNVITEPILRPLPFIPHSPKK